ncbi:hypothetical protein [Acaryochloris sp. IP29b_bin.137]|uniref:hypothetical protein n=1 Tax=Acaryochloris sp. IP29b_bin.137 TaxID=2969217 RepID=UPI00260F37A0|nr:hypothetical protein [Acaryochloris sp. IP29b_bin.137]
MQALSNLFELPLAEPAAKFTYETIQKGKNAFGAAHRQVLANIKNAFYPGLGKVDSLDDETLSYVQNRQADLMEKDWQDAQLGVYPISLLFDNPWEEFFRLYPQIWLDAPQTWARADQKNYQDFAPGIDVDSYPQYYIQNFHYQTNGYLSETSAEIYDLQLNFYLVVRLMPCVVGSWLLLKQDWLHSPPSLPAKFGFWMFPVVPDGH